MHVQQHLSLGCKSGCYVMPQRLGLAYIRQIKMTLHGREGNMSTYSQLKVIDHNTAIRNPPCEQDMGSRVMVSCRENWSPVRMHS